MTDRPMKTISLRKFRDSITDIHEVVEVSRRTPEGNIHVMGFWTPYMTYPEGARVLPDVPEPPEGSVAAARPAFSVPPLSDHARQVIKEDSPTFRGVLNLVQTPEEAAEAVPQVRPFSKADQAGRKKR